MPTRAIIALLVAATAFIDASAGSAAPARASGNPYFPLDPGTTYVYQGVRDGQPTRDVVTVTRRTVVIQGVTCVVVHDDLFVNGTRFETTDDYYALDQLRNVHYYGEDTKELDAQGHVVSTEGTWRAGVDGAQSGIIMQGNPRVGQRYREEFYRGHAEDQAKILSLSASVSVPFGTFGDALQTKNWARLDPGVVENKYYAPNVGLVHEQDLKGGTDSSDLVSVTPGENGSQ